MQQLPTKTLRAENQPNTTKHQPRQGRPIIAQDEVLGKEETKIQAPHGRQVWCPRFASAFWTLTWVSLREDARRPGYAPSASNRDFRRARPELQPLRFPFRDRTTLFLRNSLDFA